MELTKKDTSMAKGIAILGMLMLHLFCRIDNLPYTPLVWVGELPLIYYLGLFGDICVPTYCFVSGYGQAALWEKEQHLYAQKRWQRLLKFLLNYWLVLILFSVIGVFFDTSGEIPGSLSKFLGNFFLYDICYNGAWWFVLIYCFLILLAPVFLNVVQRSNSLLVFLASGCFYFASYIFRFVIEIPIYSEVVYWLWTQLILFGTSQFSFIVGILFRKHSIVGRLRALAWKSYQKNLFAGLTIFLMFIIHCVEPSLIIAPITGITTIVCFWFSDAPNMVCNVLTFLGKHSTNIWLVHMFYYLVLFPGLAFKARFPLFIVLFLLFLSTATSMIISSVYSILLKGFTKKEKQ